MSYQQERFKLIANKIREKLGTTELIKPIDFVDKIEEVYNAGVNSVSYYGELVGIEPLYAYIGTGKDENGNSIGLWDLKIYGIYSDGSRRQISREHFIFTEYSGYAGSIWNDKGILETSASVMDGHVSTGGIFVIELIDKEGNKFQPLQTISAGDYHEEFTGDGNFDIEVSKYFCVISEKEMII